MDVLAAARLPRGRPLLPRQGRHRHPEALTIGGFGIWWLIDLILTLAGLQRDKEGRLLPDFEQYRLISWIITAAAFGLSILTSAVSRVFVYVPDQVWPMMPWWQGQ